MFKAIACNSGSYTSLGIPDKLKVRAWEGKGINYIADSMRLM